MHRIMLIALMCSALYGAVLGQHAYAQEEKEVQDGAAQLLDPALTVTGPAPILPATTETEVPAAIPTPETTPPAPAPAAPAPAAGPVPSSAPPAPATPTPAPSGKSKPVAPAPGAPLPAASDCDAERAPRATTGSDRPSTSASTSARRCAPTDPKSEDRRRAAHDDEHEKPATPRAPARRTDGSPSVKDPSYASATLGAAPIGVPNFFIDKFRIPPFLLPIYQAAGIEYGIRWEVLAAINEIETDYGRNLNVSSAGALGWMQFMPATWKAYGVDANNDGEKDPFNPVDAIFAAARYLKAAGAATDIRAALWAYNHADWYVDSVLLRARLIGGLPADLVGSLTGLTQGLFPVAAKARYANDEKPGAESRVAELGENAANVVSPTTGRTGISIFAKKGAPVVAVQDAEVVRLGTSKRLGKFVQLRDVYGNTYTYTRLGSIAEAYPAPKKRTVSRAQVRRELDLPTDPKPARAASAGVQPAEVPAPAPVETVEVAKERLFANPGRPEAFENGGEDQLLDSGAAIPSYTTFRNYFTELFGLGRKDVVLRRLEVGSRVIAGTIIGRVGRLSAQDAPSVRFEIRPAGKGSPRIDPKPILDGWKLLETTAIYRAAGNNPFFGKDAANPSIGQILLMSKSALQRRVLTDPRIEIYECGQRDIRSGFTDRRVLAMLAFLSASGLKPTVTSLTCGHSYLTKSGNVSLHSSGNAADIAAINGVPILGNQGAGTVTDITIRRLLTLQGTMRPQEIISLMTYEGADNTLSLPDHNGHIHVGFPRLYGDTPAQMRRANAVLKPGQWIKLIDRIGEIENPTVAVKPSKYSIAVHPPAGAGD